jgi:hypothetical protein
VNNRALVYRAALLIGHIWSQTIVSFDTMSNIRGSYDARSYTVINIKSYNSHLLYSAKSTIKYETLIQTGSAYDLMSGNGYRLVVYPLRNMMDEPPNPIESHCIILRTVGRSNHVVRYGNVWHLYSGIKKDIN